jgi:hypothetical protein
MAGQVAAHWLLAPVALAAPAAVFLLGSTTQAAPFPTRFEWRGKVVERAITQTNAPTHVTFATYATKNQGLQNAGTLVLLARGPITPYELAARLLATAGSAEPPGISTQATDVRLCRRVQIENDDALAYVVTTECKHGTCGVLARQVASYGMGQGCENGLYEVLDEALADEWAQGAEDE